MVNYLNAKNMKNVKKLSNMKIFNNYSVDVLNA